MKYYATLLFISCVLFLTGCENSSSSSHIKVAATSVPHAEILELVKKKLAEKGIDLTIVVIDDYNIPNRALADKEVDANFFQHEPFLEAQIKDFKYPLEVLVPVHIEPMGLYSHKIKSLKDLKDGAKVAIPSDITNQARALLLLQKQGLIKLNRQDTMASVFNFVENPKHLTFEEIDSALLTRTLEDVDLAAITTNFALQAGLNPIKDALAIEDKNSPFANVIVIRKGDADRPAIQAFKKAAVSNDVRVFIIEHYKGAVIPAF
jgi:D-methionine transport system substrate-binding protein